MIPPTGLDASPTTPIVDWPILYWQIQPMYIVDSSTKKHISKYIKINKIGAICVGQFVVSGIHLSG